METPKIFESEYRFCLILWDHEPVNSTRLVQLAKEGLGWSKATTYTVIRRLSERGIVKNENAVVTALVSKEEAQKARLEEMMEETFEGSVPAFIAAFSKSKKLSRSEVDQLKALIDSYEED
ncbi:MAG: BlaI/MecI/CopY family transcriptional regulator [Oscillospiraceae bacterium]|nr:BlaI/MecI/CopY family transcriptional regulator [Oscillospiraceae bacterium]